MEHKLHRGGLKFCNQDELDKQAQASRGTARPIVKYDVGKDVGLC